MLTIIWTICTLINLFIAVLHLYIIKVGAPAYRYYGAGEWMATKAEQGSIIPASVTLAVTFVFFIFSAFSLSGAGLLNLPLSLYALAAISAIYLFRGSVIVAIPFMSMKVSTFDKVSSFAAFFIGILHAVGTYFLYVGSNS